MGVAGAASEAAKPTTRIGGLRRKRLTPWMFVAPCMIVILLVTIFPTIYSLGLSFTKWEVALKEKPFIGLGNYIALFQDERFLHSILITLIVVFVGNPSAVSTPAPAGLNDTMFSACTSSSVSLRS